MHLVVRILVGGDDRGTITWKESGFSLFPDDPLKRRILTAPIWVPIGGKLVDVFSKTDPVLFMQSLWLHYKSAMGIAVSEVEDLDEPEGSENLAGVGPSLAPTVHIGKSQKPAPFEDEEIVRSHPRQGKNASSSARFTQSRLPTRNDYSDEDGGWVTIGAVGGEGGTPVFIRGDGRIAKGPSHMIGLAPNELRTRSKEERDAARSQREAAASRHPPKRATGEAPDHSRQVEEEAGTPSAPPDGVRRAGSDQPPSPRSTEHVPSAEEVAARAPASISKVNRHLGRYAALFRANGQEKMADWMDRVKDHVNEVGVHEALEALGPDAELGAESSGPTHYEGAWFEDDGKPSMNQRDMGEWADKYLERYGITLLKPGVAPASDERIVSSRSPAQGQVRGDPYAVGDFLPKDPTFANKLVEAQHLPGLEKSEDINVLAGSAGAPVTHLTDHVISKLDDTYGKDQWIVKAYGDEAAAGYGIFFPQRAAQLKQDAKASIWEAGEHLDRYGFQLARHPDTNVVTGLVHANGDLYHFDSPEYNQTIQGDARHWADRARAAADNEAGPALPGGGKEFMAQPAFPVVGISAEDRAAGVTIKPGQEGRVHIVTRDGKAEIVPHSTWLKQEDLPVVFENADTRAMAKAAQDAIHALPESERQGQIYAPDIVKTATGYKVVEANPSNDTGSSGYLGDSPFVIDSYVSHLSGRDPAHVRFLKQILTTRGRRVG